MPIEENIDVPLQSVLMTPNQNVVRRDSVSPISAGKTTIFQDPIILPMRAIEWPPSQPIKESSERDLILEEQSYQSTPDENPDSFTFSDSEEMNLFGFDLSPELQRVSRQLDSSSDSVDRGGEDSFDAVLDTVLSLLESVGGQNSVSTKEISVIIDGNCKIFSSENVINRFSENINIFLGTHKNFVDNGQTKGVLNKSVATSSIRMDSDVREKFNIDAGSGETLTNSKDQMEPNYTAQNLSSTNDSANDMETIYDGVLDIVLYLRGQVCDKFDGQTSQSVDEGEVPQSGLRQSPDLLVNDLVLGSFTGGSRITISVRMPVLMVVKRKTLTKT